MAVEKFTGGRQVHAKAKAKIIAGMRPTRSKVIIKGGDYSSLKKRGGGRGRGGKR